MKTVFTVAGLALVLTGGCSTIKSREVVRTPPSCQDVTVSIYFEPSQADVTPEGRRVIVAAADQAKPCRVDSVQVVGLADPAGDPSANLELSKKRAAAVASAVMQAGLPAAEFDLAAIGEAGAAATPGEVRQVRRRADITLRLDPK